MRVACLFIYYFFFIILFYFNRLGHFRSPFITSKGTVEKYPEKNPESGLFIKKKKKKKETTKKRFITHEPYSH